MIIAKIPRILSRTFTSLTWNFPVEDKEVFLTFDDGPTPDITSQVLDLLEKYNAKATFFCLGNNVEAHPDIYDKIIKRGHSVGNHSYSHVKGFRMSGSGYLKNIHKAAEKIDSRLFRPPYGRIRPGQVRKVKKDFDIIMWSVLSVDYNQNISGEQVYRNVVENVRPGSIIVFHDSLKASRNLLYALPRVLEYLEENKYRMKSISSSLNQ